MDESKFLELMKAQTVAILAANAESTTAAIKPLTDQITALEVKLAANVNKELDIKRAAVKSHFKLTDDAVKDLGVNSLDAFYAQTTSATAIAANSAGSDASESLLDMIPEA